MREQGVDEDYIDTMRNIYENGTSILRLHKATDEIKTGVQIDDISNTTEARTELQ